LGGKINENPYYFSIKNSSSDSYVALLSEIKQTTLSTDLVGGIFQLQNKDGSFSFSKNLQTLFSNDVNFEKVQRRLAEQ
ncbi:unnamed protein product, partial [Didymodactylos carnosus]